MRAVIRKGIVLGHTFSFTHDFPEPLFQPQGKHKNDVQVKVSAAAINPVDYKLPRAVLGPVVGMDFCGIVTEVGSHVGDSFQVGDAVFGKAAQGSLAEYTIAKASVIAKAPRDWKPVECAALPVAYQSALQALQRGKIVDRQGGSLQQQQQEGKSVLVVGASGGCGIAAIQLCKAVGVSRIVAICSKKNQGLVKDMGATEMVDYTDSQMLETFFRENLGKFDFVLDAATNSGGGEDYWDKCIPLLKRKEGEDGDKNDEMIAGHFAALNGPASKWTRTLVGLEKPHESLIMMNANTADLEQVVSLLNKSGLRPLTHVMTFDEKGMEEAFELLKSRRTTGKIVLDIAGHGNN